MIVAKNDNTAMTLDTAMTHPVPQFAVAQLTYRPKCEDELYLTAGQTIRVLSLDPDRSGSAGWWVGQNDVGQVGVFPANYVQLQAASSEGGSYRNSFCDPAFTSMQDSASSLSLEGTLVGNRVAARLMMTDFARGHLTDDDGANDDRAVRTNGEGWETHELSADAANDLITINSDDIILGDSIGAGSFGTVYRGTWEGKTVALKVYHQMKSQVDREATNLGQLSHPNVVNFFGCWMPHETLSTLPALVMEFGYGGSLHSMVRRRPPIYPDTILGWCMQIADGMHYLHTQAGLVHRDLKTANILIREPLETNLSPEDLRTKTLMITDFGMSCHAEVACHSRVSGVGTAAYAAPEVICMEIFSLASDVWSYGVVMWELFTMQEPFKEFDRAQQLVNIGRYRQKLFIPPLKHGFPAKIENLLTRCWADHWADRPSFGDVLIFLESVQTDDTDFIHCAPDEFVAIQESWSQDIADEADSNILTESCSSEASSPLRQQYEKLKSENAQMRDDLLALKENEAFYRGTIENLKKDNQALSNMVKLNNENSATSSAVPAPRKRPFVWPPFFRRTEARGVGATPLCPAGNPPPLEQQKKSSTGRRHGKTKSGSSCGGGVSVPSYFPSQVPNNLPPSPSHAALLNTRPPYCPQSPNGFAHFLSPAVDSPTATTDDCLSPPAIAGSGGYQFQSAWDEPFPPVHPKASLPLDAQRWDEDGPMGRVVGSRGFGGRGMKSYESAPDLIEKINSSSSMTEVAAAVATDTLGGRHTVSKGSALHPTRKLAVAATTTAHTNPAPSKRHRTALSALFHPSRSKNNSTSDPPAPYLLSDTPSITTLSPTPLSPSSPCKSTNPPLPPTVPLSNYHRGKKITPSKKKTSSTGLRRISIQRMFPSDRGRDIGEGGSAPRKSSGGKKSRKQRSPVSPDSPTPQQQLHPPTNDSSEASSLRPMRTVPSLEKIPPLPPYLLRRANTSRNAGRRLIDLIPPPPAPHRPPSPPDLLPTSPPHKTIPRPRTLRVPPDGNDGDSRRRNPSGPPTSRGVVSPAIFATKSHSLSAIFDPSDEEEGGEQDAGKSNRREVSKADSDPVPMTLWTTICSFCAVPLLLPTASSSVHRTARDDASNAAPSPASDPPRSAPFNRSVTFSPFAGDDQDDRTAAEAIIGKAQSVIGRISSFLALTSSSATATAADRSRQMARRDGTGFHRAGFNHRELSAPASSTALQQQQQSWQFHHRQSEATTATPLPFEAAALMPETAPSSSLSLERRCQCECVSTGCGVVVARSLHSSTTPTGTASSHSSQSSWQPLDNPVALSRDAYLKVTQDGYLNRSVINGDLYDLGVVMGPPPPPPSDFGLPSPDPPSFSSPAASSSSFLDSPSGASDAMDVCVLVDLTRGDNGDNHRLSMPRDDDDEPNFGAGEAAEDTMTLYAEFQHLPDNNTHDSDAPAFLPSPHDYKAVFGAVAEGQWDDVPSPIIFPDGGSYYADRPVDLLSFPCRRRKAFRMKDRPDGIVSSPEEGDDVAAALCPESCHHRPPQSSETPRTDPQESQVAEPAFSS